MNGNFNPIYINSTQQVLEQRCLRLLCEGYHLLKSADQITIDMEEEAISKELILSLKTSKTRAKWEISIFPEYRIYKNDNVAAKEAPRIDFKFSCWTSSNEWEYYAEAKNLIEINTPKVKKKGKKDNTITINAKYLHRRYVETGIDNYVSRNYPSNGCLIGYVLQGKVENIVSLINENLHNLNRSNEILEKQLTVLDELKSCYTSVHNNSFTIKHLMFDFVPA